LIVLRVHYPLTRFLAIWIVPVNSIEHVLEGGSEVEHVGLGSIPKTIYGFAR
jgi:hypothetical protein